MLAGVVLGILAGEIARRLVCRLRACWLSDAQPLYERPRQEIKGVSYW